jgi:hypothetical protein
MKPLRHVARAVLLASLAFVARADHPGRPAERFRANLVGLEETPAIFTAGSGVFTMKVNDDDTQIDFELSYENLSGPPAVAHVHFGQRGVAGGVSFFFCGGGGKPACPATTSGTVAGSVVAADVVGPTAQGIAAGDLAAILQMIRAGYGYANMHTAAHPAGEIRGQIRTHSHSHHD